MGGAYPGSAAAGDLGAVATGTAAAAAADDGGNKEDHRWYRWKKGSHKWLAGKPVKRIYYWCACKAVTGCKARKVEDRLALDKTAAAGDSGGNGNDGGSAVLKGGGDGLTAIGGSEKQRKHLPPTVLDSALVKQQQQQQQQQQWQLQQQQLHSHGRTLSGVSSPSLSPTPHSSVDSTPFHPSTAPPSPLPPRSGTLPPPSTPQEPLAIFEVPQQSSGILLPPPTTQEPLAIHTAVSSFALHPSQATAAAAIQGIYKNSRKYPAPHTSQAAEAAAAIQALLRTSPCNPPPPPTQDPPTTRPLTNTITLHQSRAAATQDLLRPSNVLQPSDVLQQRTGAAVFESTQEATQSLRPMAGYSREGVLPEALQQRKAAVAAVHALLGSQGYVFESPQAHSRAAADADAAAAAAAASGARAGTDATAASLHALLQRAQEEGEALPNLATHAPISMQTLLELLCTNAPTHALSNLPGNDSLSGLTITPSSSFPTISSSLPASLHSPTVPSSITSLNSSPSLPASQPTPSFPSLPSLPSLPLFHSLPSPSSHCASTNGFGACIVNPQSTSRKVLSPLNTSAAASAVTCPNGWSAARPCALPMPHNNNADVSMQPSWAQQQGSDFATQGTEQTRPIQSHPPAFTAGEAADADGVSLSDADGVSLSDAEGVSLSDAEGVSLSDAEGVSLSDAEGVSLSDAEGVSLSDAEGVSLSDATLAALISQGPAAAASFGTEGGLSDTTTWLQLTRQAILETPPGDGEMGEVRGGEVRGEVRGGEMVWRRGDLSGNSQGLIDNAEEEIGDGELGSESDVGLIFDSLQHELDME
ncbi:unnamed protein product [Closterium sp. Naga37s-1]|nr:unnamed protein product [Closterium sp. Naga37s-1]